MRMGSGFYRPDGREVEVGIDTDLDLAGLPYLEHIKYVMLLSVRVCAIPLPTRLCHTSS